MGFSLERFFNELLSILENAAKHESGDASRDLRDIEAYVKQMQKYAKECGRI